MSQLELVFAAIEKKRAELSVCDLKSALKTGKIFTISNYHRTFFSCSWCKNKGMCTFEDKWLKEVFDTFIPEGEYLPLNNTFPVIRDPSGKTLLSYYHTGKGFYLVEKQKSFASTFAISVTNKRIIDSVSWRYCKNREELNMYLKKCPDVSCPEKMGGDLSRNKRTP